MKFLVTTQLDKEKTHLQSKSIQFLKTRGLFSFYVWYKIRGFFLLKEMIIIIKN
jgi:hypothetical protein